MMHHLPPLSSPSFVKISVISIFCTRVPHCHFALILSSLLLLVSHFNLPPPHLTLHHLLHISHFFVVAHLASISPQICIRVSSQGRRPPYLLTCSLLSQVICSLWYLSLPLPICLCQIDLSSSAQLQCSLLSLSACFSVFAVWPLV